MHHKIVALDAWFVPIPESLINLPTPHTYELVNITTKLRSIQEIQDVVRDATIVCMNVTPMKGSTLDSAITPSLQFIVAIAVGTDCIDVELAEARGIQVVNCPNCNTDTVANHALAMYFATRRHLVQLHNTVLGTNEWKEKSSLTSVLNDRDGKAPMTCQDEIIGIIGYGSVGKRIAELCRSLGMKVLISARKGKPAEGDRTLFAEVLARSSIIVLCIPRNPETIGLISTTELRNMSHFALLINVSRGGIVDESALLEALQAGSIGGAATDVLEQEPSSAGQYWKEGDSPLLKVDAVEAGLLNLIVTPHIAWFSTTTIHNYLQAFKQHVEDFAREAE